MSTGPPGAGAAVAAGDDARVETLDDIVVVVVDPDAVMFFVPPVLEHALNASSAQPTAVTTPNVVRLILGGNVLVSMARGTRRLGRL